MRRGLRNSSDAALARARRFRREATISERRFWEIVRDNRLGHRFRRQVAVGPYFLDFFCPTAMLCVEVDGEAHELKRNRDARRDAFLAVEGILTHRIRSLALFDGEYEAIEEVYRDLRRLLSERTKGEI